MTLKEKIKKLLPRQLLSVYHFGLAFLGAVIFCFPGLKKSIKIIGVTGTSGKSTTVNFITKILQEAGFSLASASSIKFNIGQKEWENKYKMTMPGRFVIQRFLKQAVSAGSQFVVLEVTSEGIRQFRHKFINFDTAVFTNLSPEHIESHGGFENYRNEKLKLFKATKNIHIINTDDENKKHFWDIPAKQKIGFSINSLEKDDLQLKLQGGFNIMNALAAITVAKAYGVDFNVCKKALEKIEAISGRMEVVSESPIKIVVDYAHTPAQLEAVYKSFTGKNMICVLGSCGGGRDKWKRPVLGQLAEKYCSQVIITNEDPYDENPLSIMKEIESALSNDGAGPKHQIIIDRKEAIEKAIKLAKSGDIVIITGKGSEPWMCLENGKKIPWDDRKIAKEILNNL